MIILDNSFLPTLNLLLVCRC